MALTRPALQRPASTPHLGGAEALAHLNEISAWLKADRLAPYLGPGLLAGVDSVPLGPEALAAALNLRHPSPGRIRTNLWAVAQFIEQRRHRKTLAAWMGEIFAPQVPPTPFQAFLATLPLGLIVDTWYDDSLRAAFQASGRMDWGEVQGITRAGETRDIWTRAYDATGALADPESPADWTTLLYKPHGAVRPAHNFLVADSDYVEVMTEIDIQSPIPPQVRERRSFRGFVFLGCRFHDQMLRTYARQIMKRSRGPHFAVMDADTLTRNEARFLAEQEIALLDLPLPAALDALMAS
ncbi:MAG: SIR2 family protein [Pseudomonadota bacterium]